MFFVLSKTLDLLIDPLWWGLILITAGLALVLRDRRRAGLTTAACGLATLVVLSSPSVANRLEFSLENEVASSVRSDVTYDAVVLLGGMVNPLGALVDEPAWNDNIERVIATRRLMVAGRARFVIVSGGEYGLAGLPTEAEFLARQLIEWGVPLEQIIIEDKANNTRENATFTKEIVQARGLKSLLVVTSAFHMPRAAGCFRAVGLETDFLPVDFRMRNPGLDSHVLPRAEYLRASSAALRERFGALVYRVMGYAK